MLTSKSLNINTGILFSHESEYRKNHFFSKIVIDHLIDYKFQNKKFIEVGNLNIKRDIGYAEEYVEAIYKINTKNNKEKYIVSSNKLYALYELIEMALENLEIKFHKDVNKNQITYINKKNSEVIIKSSIKKFRKIELDSVKGDNSKIKKDLNWSPRVGLNTIVNKMINFQLNKVK